MDMTPVEQLVSTGAATAALTGLLGWWRERAASKEKLAFMRTEAELKGELAATSANAARISRLESMSDRQDREIIQLRDQLAICQGARHEQEKKVAVLEVLQAQRDVANGPPQLKIGGKIERENA